MRYTPGSRINIRPPHLLVSSMPATQLAHHLSLLTASHFLPFTAITAMTALSVFPSSHFSPGPRLRCIRNEIIRIRRRDGASVIQVPDLVFGEVPTNRSEISFQLIHSAGSDDWGGNTWLLQKPVDRHLGGTPPCL
jgi:hypothetical protein